MLHFMVKVFGHIKTHRSTWIFLDRDSQADDNAEHMYRYVREKNPELNIYFLLRKKSHDWARLKKDGFRLIPFGSLGICF